MSNRICHLEIGCCDRERTSKFYERMVDWKRTSEANATYISTDHDGAGHSNSLGHEPHNYTIFYVMVDDVSEALAKAESLGGGKLVGPIAIPSGLFDWFDDPEGNTIAMYTDKKKENESSQHGSSC